LGVVVDRVSDFALRDNAFPHTQIATLTRLASGTVEGNYRRSKGHKNVLATFGPLPRVGGQHRFSRPRATDHKLRTIAKLQPTQMRRMTKFFVSLEWIYVGVHRRFANVKNPRALWVT
jgi:hypothetical protein